jgi:hypothetical protein
MSSTITLAPVAFDNENGGSLYASRVAILATDYLGNHKGMWYTPNYTEAAAYARDLIGHVDTKVYLFNTDSDGEAIALPFALISKESGWLDHPSCLVSSCAAHSGARTCGAVA